MRHRFTCTQISTYNGLCVSVWGDVFPGLHPHPRQRWREKRLSQSRRQAGAFLAHLIISPGVATPSAHTSRNVYTPLGNENANHVRETEDPKCSSHKNSLKLMDNYISQNKRIYNKFPYFHTDILPFPCHSQRKWIPKSSITTRECNEGSGGLPEFLAPLPAWWLNFCVAASVQGRPVEWPADSHTQPHIATYNQVHSCGSRLVCNRDVHASSSVSTFFWIMKAQTPKTIPGVISRSICRSNYYYSSLLTFSDRRSELQKF